jgi:hypothetical protein
VIQQREFQNVQIERYTHMSNLQKFKNNDDYDDDDNNNDDKHNRC